MQMDVATMSERKKTARKGAQIVVIIEGEQYDNLERVAQVMNGVSWCGDANTAETVFNEFIWHWNTCTLNSVREIAECVSGAIATGNDRQDAPEPLHTERQKELITAFHVFEKCPQ